MEIEFKSETVIEVNLPNGKSFTLMYYEKGDELSIAFHGGKRHIKQHQNRPDGYSGTTFTKAE
jgi:hypothetical protein